MHYAARSKRVSAMDLLLSKGADISAISEEGRSILHEAAARDNVAVIERIFELLNSSLRSKVDIADHQGLTPLVLAKKRGAAQAVHYLEARSANSGNTSSQSTNQEARPRYATWKTYCSQFWRTKAAT